MKGCVRQRGRKVAASALAERAKTVREIQTGRFRLGPTTLEAMDVHAALCGYFDIGVTSGPFLVRTAPPNRYAKVPVHRT